jgi:hypothetical protein
VLKYFIFAIFIVTSILSAEERPFRMGFSPWSYEATQSGVDWIYSTITTYGDIVSHHIEEGVPWQECFAGQPFPTSFAQEIRNRINKTPSSKKMLLQINPLNIGRNGLAPYRGESVNMPLTAPWNTMALNNDSIKTAFLNYAKSMIDSLNPDYLLIGVEVNLLISNNRSLWPQYVELHRYVFTELKKLHPTLPVGASVFCVPFFPEWSSKDTLAYQLQGLSDITSYVDYIAFSIHPFMSGLLCDSLPVNYFQRLFALTSKPISISESSYPAQTWLHPDLPSIVFSGTPEKQTTMLSLLLSESASRNALFVIWFAVRDYDTLWHNTLGDSPDVLPWRDTGLFDEPGNPRQAFTVWQEWYSSPYITKIAGRAAPSLVERPFSVIGIPDHPMILFNSTIRNTKIKLYDIRGRLQFIEQRSSQPLFTLPDNYYVNGILLCRISCEGKTYSIKLTNTK